MAEGKHYAEVIEYAQKIIKGEIIANKYRVKGCQRFLDDLKNPKYDFRTEDADFCIDIIEKTLCHQQGEKQDGTPLRGTPFLLMDFHKFIIYNLLGFKLKGTSVNRFQEALIFIPRKNVKTSFASALAYALGLRYRKSGSKIYVVAAALKQSLETFNFVKYNLERMNATKNQGGPFRIVDNHNEHTITATLSDGFFNLVALAANPDAQDSFNCNFAIADEIHAFKKPKQYNLFKEAMKAYSNKLLIGISTAGDDPNSFLAQKVRYGKKVLDKEISDEHYFFFIAEADATKTETGKEFVDYTNPITHQKANPAYGESIRASDILADSLQAQNDPQQRKDFFAKSLNVFTAPMEAYFDMAEVTTSDEKYTYTLEELAKLPIDWYGGADLSKMHDLTGVSLHGRYKEVDIAITHGFMPATQAYIKADEDNIPFLWWQEQGWLTLCNSEVIEYADVVRWFESMRSLGFKPKWVGYDRRYAREFVIKMRRAGFKMRDQWQRYTEKTEAFREIEKQIKMGKFCYMGSKAYEYCIGNVKAIEDGDDFVQYKKVNPKERIDLFDADVIATKQMLIGMEKSEAIKGWFEKKER